MIKVKKTTIKIIQGDITEQEVEAVVNAANNELRMGGGVAGAIKRKGGQSIQEEANKISPIPVGEAAVTGAGNLKAKYVIHAVTMALDFKTDEETIRQSTANTLNRAEEYKIKAIAFPALGCGVGRLPIETAAKVMSQVVFSHLHKCESSLQEIIFVLYSKNDWQIFDKVAGSYLSYIQKKIEQGPFVTVDAIIGVDSKVVLIKRKNPPFGWALPGGFVNYGESLEKAVMREVKEETNLDLENLKQFHTYSDPQRDPRFHTISTVFIARAKGNLQSGSDAGEVKLFSLNELPDKIAFDHRKILKDYIKKQ